MLTLLPRLSNKAELMLCDLQYKWYNVVKHEQLSHTSISRHGRAITVVRGLCFSVTFAN